MDFWMKIKMTLKIEIKEKSFNSLKNKEIINEIYT